MFFTIQNMPSYKMATICTKSEYTVKTCCIKGQNDWTTIQPITQVVVDNLTLLKVLQNNKMFCQESSTETTLKEFEMASLDCTLHGLATLASKKMKIFEKLYPVILRNVLILKLNTNLVLSINQIYTLNIMNNGKILIFWLLFAPLLKNFIYIFKTTCFIHSNLTAKKNHSRTGVKVTN